MCPQTWLNYKVRTFGHLVDDDTVGQGIVVEFGKEQRKHLPAVECESSAG